ncbi:MAG: rhodanese-like domain-containing protein [Bdellovibrionaceae bacterium]|nr:rhodanese-like domain-containing protein [Pseudobdellovibrionaceae bacterium]
MIFSPAAAAQIPPSACSAATPANFILNSPEIDAGMRAGSAPFEVKTPSSRACLSGPSANSFVLEMKTVGGKSYPFVRYWLKSLRQIQPGILEVTPVNKDPLRLPQSSILAPLCMDFCDSIVIYQPGKTAWTFETPLVFDVFRKGYQEELKTLPRYDRLLKTIHAKSDSDIEKMIRSNPSRAVYVIGESPKSMAAVDLMRKIRTSTRRPIHWIRGGPSVKRDLYPGNLPPGTRRIGTQELRDSMKRGEKVYYIGRPSDLTDFEQFFSGKPWIQTGLLQWNDGDPFFPAGSPESFPHIYFSDETVLKLRRASRIDADLLPKIKKLPVILMGYAVEDWRPFVAAIHLQRMGFQNILLYEGGLEQWKRDFPAED